MSYSEPTTLEVKDPQEKETLHEQSNPTLTLFNHDFDIDTIVIGIIISVIWVIIWKTSGLWNVMKNDILFMIIFYSFLLYVIINVITAGTTSGGVVYELNILLTVEQMISILLGSVIIFALFSSNLNSHPKCKDTIFRLIMNCVVVLSLSSLWVNVITTGRAFRAIRKFKQGSYNIALSLFIIIGLIYVRGNECLPISPSS